MARVSNTLIGPSSGRVGNAVFSTWKGINVLKEKPISVANPNSDGQQMQRSAMRQIVAAFRQIPAVIRSGFKKLAVQKSEWNAFASYNLKNAFDFSAPPAATLEPENLLISKGTISSTPIASVNASHAAQEIYVNWDPNASEPGKSSSDSALVAVYNQTKDDWTQSSTNALRSLGTATTAMPAGWEVNDTVTIYLGFYNQLSGESSDSANKETTIQA